MIQQETLDGDNALFWDELCGSKLAISLGIADNSSDSLAQFDAAYMDLYPYLPGYLPSPATEKENVLEIGLGYGTVSEALARRGFLYHGLDIAEGPVLMVRERLARVGGPQSCSRVLQGSALELPYPELSFDHVVSIGCLHHTGNAEQAVAEVYRVLRYGGTATIMLYNSHSLGRAYGATRSLLEERRLPTQEEWSAIYDGNTHGESAPKVEFVSSRSARQLFSTFSNTKIRPEFIDPMRIGRWRPSSKLLLAGLSRIGGRDLYISATK